METIAKTELELTPVQKFIASLLNVTAVTWGLRKPKEFLDAFPPTVLMEKIESADIRAAIVHECAGTKVPVALLMPRASAAEQIQFGLDASVVSALGVMRACSPSVLARYLGNEMLWTFIVGGSFSETPGTEDDGSRDSSKDDPRDDLVEAILAQAFSLGLVTAEEIVEAIGFQAFFGNVPHQSVINVFDAFAHAASEKGFAAILDRIPLASIVTGRIISRQVLWTRVILPLIAVRHGLSRSAVERDERILSTFIVYKRTAMVHGNRFD